MKDYFWVAINLLKRQVNVVLTVCKRYMYIEYMHVGLVLKIYDC